MLLWLKKSPNLSFSNMKILFISNLYPPYYVGGYEQLCMDVVEGLSAKGHNCHVLTSTYGVGGSVLEGQVHRLLELEGDFHGKRYSFVHSDSIRTRNEAIVRKVIMDIAPDILFIWNMRRFSRSLLFLAEKLHTKVVYYVTDNWLLDQYRPTRENLRKYIQSYRHLLSRPELQNVICSSEHMKNEMIENHIPLDRAHVVHNGVDLEPYLKIMRPEANNGLDILYAGRLVSEKGTHTLLQAFISLVQKAHAPKLHLTIVGGGEDSYIAELKAMSRFAGTEKMVTFTGNVSREELAGYFAGHDIFVFPSIWQEPFSLTLIMALASEIPVVGTLTGGSKEILTDMYNCLAFEAGDSTDLADKLQILIDDAGLRKSLAMQGRLDSMTCNLPVMIDKVERILENIVNRHT
jgi:glycogen synthase